MDKYELQKLRDLPIEGVAERLGLRVTRHKSLCPFHDDHNASLSYHTGKNTYRCFVCGARGGTIDLAMQLLPLSRGSQRGSFKDACRWLANENNIILQSPYCPAKTTHKGQTLMSSKSAQTHPDIEWLSSLIRVKHLNEEARRFLFEERKIDPRVVAWCGLTSISQPAPCWRYGKPFYDAPSLLIPYYDVDGRLVSVQSRYLGTLKTTHKGQTLMGSAEEASEQKARFKFPRGSNCHIYGLQILKLLRPGEELWITEGCSDCWAMLSSGHKAIAIPSATLLKEKDLKPLETCHLELGTSFHMYPDNDAPGERLFLQLKEFLPNLTHHQLPMGCKDYSDYYIKSYETSK